ncbi:MAG: head GIN domain-containing protein [Melioribacteraceae bacterium]
MKIKILLALLIISISLVGCFSSSVKGSGNSVTEERKLDYVSRIEVDGNFNIEITSGEISSLTIEAEDNINPIIETKVEDEKLTIKMKERITNLREIRIKISTHDLVELESDGKSNIKVKGLNTDDFELSSEGEGEIHIEGKVDYLNVSMDGEGKLFAKDLLAKTAKVNLYGDGKAEVNARKSLKAKVKGSGSVDYYGDPEEISIDTSKGGAVNKK